MYNRFPFLLLIFLLLFHILLHKEQSNSYNLDLSPLRRPTAQRKNITILVVIDSRAGEKEYKFSLATINCYAKKHKYDLMVVEDSHYQRECRQKDPMFRRHCISSRILTISSPTIEWLLFLDADIAIANPNPLIEEYLMNDAELIMYDRFMGWEIAMGSYLAKNTPWARDFLSRFANFEEQLPDSFHGTDNGAIHAFLLKELPLTFHQQICLDIWGEAKNYEDLFLFVACVRIILGVTDRIGPIKITPKGRGWVRDGWMTQSRWNPERDFMLHGFKAADRRIRTGIYFFDKLRELFSIRFRWYSFLDDEPTNCQWTYDEDLIVSEEELNQEMFSLHRIVQKCFYRMVGQLSSRLL